MRFRTFFLLLVIAVCGAFIYLKVSSLGDENSRFNQVARYRLGKSSFARTILSLHKDGDARGWYLVGDTPIIVEVVSAKGAELNEEALQIFVKSVKEYTGRQVDVYNVDTIQNGSLSSIGLAEIDRSFRRHVKPKQPNLFIIYAEEFVSKTEEVGMTYREYGMVLSHNRLVSLTSRYPQALPQYIASTMLHEFGHQLGLDHVDNKQCVMHKDVENPASALSFSGIFTSTEFCSEEFEALNKIRASLQ